MDFSKFIKKARVAYIPLHAHNDINHPDVEYGYVSSHNEVNVFVKFDKQLNGREWDQVTSQSCSPDSLKLI